MLRIIFGHSYTTFFFIILLQGYTLSLERYSRNSHVQYFKNNVVSIKNYKHFSTEKCTLESCGSQAIGLPYGEQIFSLPSEDVTPLLPISKEKLKEMENLDSRRIIGGKAIPITDFPFIVSVQQQTHHACGGSYIKDKWVLTAAHCLVREFVDSPLRNPAEFRIVMGSALIEGNSTDKTNIQVRQVLMLYPHEDYSKAIALNDIGLIKIAKPFILRIGVGFAPLPKSVEDGEYRNESCTVLGWGTTVQQTSKASPMLMSTQVPLLSITKCQKIYDIDRIVPLKVICAGFEEGGKDACQGDSGGPLVCHNIETGLVSWGRECGRKDQPGVYTRVDHYLEWIEQTMKRYNLEPDYTTFYKEILYSSPGNKLNSLFLNTFCKCILFCILKNI